MQSTLLHVLLIESGLESASVIAAGLLSNNPLVNIQVTSVSSLDAGKPYLTATGIDVVLLDVASTEGVALETLLRLQCEYPAVPVVVMVNDVESPFGLDAIRSGAQDLISKAAVSGNSLTRSLLFATVRHRKLHGLKLAANLDQLTDLPNRRAFIEAFQDLDRSRPNALALLDVDHFRQLNEDFGHLGGDQALRHMAQTLSTEMAGIGRVYRYGGEEFAILVQLPLELASDRLTELLAVVQSLSIEVDARPLTMTVSAGLTQVSSKDTYLHAVQRCDRALYDAKARGRNRIVLAEEPSLHRPIISRYAGKRPQPESLATTAQHLPRC